MDPRQFVKIYEALTARIDSGELPAGTRLNIGGIAAEFDVSRDTVQRSIGMLADDGKVQRWAGLGWYVTGEGAPEPG
jgi:DNA-binding GntR family transcriptional regulator